MNNVIFIMGVSGCGKSTIGQLLAQELQIPFFDGDDFYPQSNIDKMSNGLPLNDDDRYGWLLSLNELAKKQLEQNSCVIVCSALKKSYKTSFGVNIGLYASLLFACIISYNGAIALFEYF